MWNGYLLEDEDARAGAQLGVGLLGMRDAELVQCHGDLPQRRRKLSNLSPIK